jgi:dTDP-4-amino-4,6-dideoxygalactose transaminase
MIHFNSSVSSPQLMAYLQELNSDYLNYRTKLYSEKSLGILKQDFPASKLFLCSSATDALEMVAFMMDLKEGDEVIMPSFTFVSTANAFVSKGATPVFVDVDLQTGSIDPALLQAALTEKTKAVVLVHYLGICPNMAIFQDFCKENNLLFIEDAAMGFGNSNQGRPLGSMGDFGVVSFDITKQISSVQGGLLIVNNPAYQERANQLYHIGTNRTAFEKGEKPYYEWVDVGSKFQMNELNAAFLYDQLSNQTEILARRNEIIRSYHAELMPLAKEGRINILHEQYLDEAVHAFVIVVKSAETREKLQAYLKSQQIEAMFHYIPLHSSKMGRKCGRFIGGNHTELLAGTILRLPVHLNLSTQDVLRVCKEITAFYLQNPDA